MKGNVEVEVKGPLEPRGSTLHTEHECLCLTSGKWFERFWDW